MATPVNAEYQIALYQEFERNLPDKWFRRLRNQDGALYPFIWGLCGALAGLQEAIESATDQAIPATSEGFWLSLHLLGLGLVRRGEETDQQAYQRYQFEFSQTRNTREGLLRQLTAHSGLEPPELRLATGFAKGLYGELTLEIDTDQHWSTINWWWLRPYLEEWVANGLARKATINTGGLRTVGFRPWDFYTRFPMGPDLLKPFWDRPAFLSELRIFEFERIFGGRVDVSEVVGGWQPPSTAYSLPAADRYSLPSGFTTIFLVPSALIDSPISRNILGFVCVENWESEALRITEIWRSIAAAYRRGQPFIYMGDDSTCQRLVVANLEIPVIPFPGDGPIAILGHGPWRLRLGQGDDLTATTITDPIDVLLLAGQWWLDETGTIRRSVPETFLDGTVRLQLEFLIAKRAEPFYLREIELTLGYDQVVYGVVLGWSIPTADAWSTPIDLSLPSGDNQSALTFNVPTLAPVYYRRVDAWIPPDVNVGLLLDITTVSTALRFEDDQLLFDGEPLFFAG